MDDLKHSTPENNPDLEEKIYVIADEVLDILKDLSKDNKKQLNSKLIAERMFIKDTVKKMLIGREQDSEDKDSGSQKTNTEFDRLKGLTYSFLDKFSDLAPDTITEEINELKNHFHDKDSFDYTASRLDAIIKYIKIYFDALTIRNKELDAFMKQTIKYLQDTEEHIDAELSSHQNKFNEDREFENNISINMNNIKNDFETSGINTSNDFNSLRMAVMGKIENINKGIEKKREQDMLKLRETEKTLENMGNRINTIKKEAEDIKKKAEEIEKESLRDKLTGLYNRKAYDQKTVETLANLNRYDVPSSLIFCDIDFFKKINDTFGHRVGDLALKKLAALFKEKLRVNDFISRYGGEEFAIILPHTSNVEALKAGEGIRKYIDDALFSYKSRNIPLKISIGISTFRKDDSAETVMERADSALYLAKNSGRNTVKTENDVAREGNVLSRNTVT